jgi:hypothetical protein
MSADLIPDQEGVDHWLATAAGAVHRGAVGLLELFTAGQAAGRRVWFQRVWALGLVLLSGILWAYILNWGKINFLYSDWAEGMGHRIAFLADAVRTGQLPLHMQDASALRNITDRYLAIPDTIISPQVVLLKVLSPGIFVVANTLLLYALGSWGLWQLSKRYRWSPLVFAFVLFLFNFNGHITDHIVVGHVHWVGYFLLPWFAYLILEAVETPVGWRWILKLDLILLTMFLQGAFHLFVMGLIFMGLLGLSRRRLFAPMVKAGFFAGLVCAVRLLPPALETGQFDTAFLSGFDTSTQLVDSMLNLRLATQAEVFRNSPLNPLGWWELDHFIGLVGLLFVAGFGLSLWVRRRSDSPTYPELAVPVLGMTVLSIGRIYEPINRLGIPLLSSQRVSSRFFVYALVFLTFLAAIHVQRLIEEGRFTSVARLALAAGWVVLVDDLWQHTKLWRVAHLPDMFNSRDVNLSLAHVANHPDPPYTAALVAGLAISLLATGFLIWKARQEG